MSSSAGSVNSITERTSGLFANGLHIRGYCFRSTVTPCVTHGVNASIVHGYKISNKMEVAAKVSTNSLQLEREFYTVKHLYHLPDGPLYIVRPIECIDLQNGVSAAIYAKECSNSVDPFTDHLQNRRDSNDGVTLSSRGSSNGKSTPTIANRGDNLQCSSQPPMLLSPRHSIDDVSSTSTLTECPIDIHRFLKLAIQCTDALEFIHKHRTVHGEIRLQAFQWDESSAKLWNFGVDSKSLEALLTSDGWKKTSTIKHLQSILVFMSPEQTGRTTYTPDHRSDIYSLGIMFFVLLTNQHPYDGGPLEILNGVLSRKMPFVHELRLDIPEMLSKIIAKMTNKAPDDRYISIHGVRWDLQECQRLLSWNTDEKRPSVPSFTLAQHDIASVFRLPKTIYGRDASIQTMDHILALFASKYKPLRSFSRALVDTTSSTTRSPDEWEAHSDISGNDSRQSVTLESESSIRDITHSQGSTMLVSLYGPGGIGKSTIFSAVQASARRIGYVATTKFDSRNKVPYTGILKTLSQILQQILSESEDDIRLFYNHLKKHLGPQFCNIQLLADYVPELKPLLDPIMQVAQEQGEATHMDNAEMRIRFHTLFIEVFRVIAHWQITTLFLDDLHQADEPSLELLKSLIASKVKTLIYISYRDQEITPKLAELLEKYDANITFIEVDVLSMSSLTDFICDTLHRPRDRNREQVEPLAEIIFRRTAGNPFYTAQLLRTLARKKLIFFNWEKNEWDFLLDAIQDGAGYNVHADSQLDVSFLVARLKELPEEGQTLLKWASFVGDTFSWATVKNLMQSSQETLANLSDDDDDDDDILSEMDSIGSVTMAKNLPSCNFSETTVTTIHSTNNPLKGLQSVIQEGYIILTSADEFKWAHDRIAQAAGELASPKARCRIHLAIAQYMMKEKEVDTFLVADHLLRCMDLLMAMEDRAPYRDLLIEAGNKGQSSGAHSMAFKYYEAAIELKDPSTEWNNDKYHHTLLLYTNAASLSWVVGRYERTEELLEPVFQNAKTSMDRLSAYRILAKYYYGCEMIEKGRRTLHHCLEELGSKNYHVSTCNEELQREYEEVERMIKETGIENMANFKACRDPLLRGIMGILEGLCTAAYWDNEKSEMYYCGIQILKLSLAEGITPVSAVGCTFAGIGYAVLYQKNAFAEELGALGLQWVNKHGGLYEKGRVYMQYAVFVLQWKYHHREAFKYFEEGIRLSISSGDRIYLSYHQVNRLIVLFCLNRNVADTLAEAEKTYEDIHTWSSSIGTNMFAMTILRACKALQGRTFVDTPDVFDGHDGFDSAHFVNESCKQSSSPELLKNRYDTFKLVLQVLYGHLDAAIATGYQCLATIDGHPCHQHTRIMYHYFSLALVTKMRDGQLDSVERRRFYDQVKVNQQRVYQWAKHSQANYMMFYTLIEAELATIDKPGDIEAAAYLYERAIDWARDGQWHLELCVAYECMGAFYSRVGLQNIAFASIRKAIDLYMAHGSYGKARHVSNRYADLISAYDDERNEAHEVGIQTDANPYMGAPYAPRSISSYEHHHHHNNNNNDSYISEPSFPVTTEETLMTLDILDMASILKSSQVMSSEIRFDCLLTSMMSIILENSGAQCGAIIVKETKFGVCAYGNQKEDPITFDPPKKLSEMDDLVSDRIINHTIHTNESIFIHNVEQDQRFAVGPWFERLSKKSVICMPITHKSTVVGCLFIEGAVGVFTQRHVTVLGLLCQQMSISITNAFLFKSVQQVTKDNMKMIEMQKQALEEAKRSKDAADKATRLREIFLANMSHEIRTPFSGFYGMISLLADTKLDSEQYDLVKTAKESCENLLKIIDDLLNFSKLQAGKVTLDLSPVVVEDVIADVVEMLIPMAIQKRINVTYWVANDVPAVVFADDNRLRQIIINLVGNAIKFTHRGEISVRCSIDSRLVTNNDNDNIPLLFEVVDTGIGISEEQRRVLFVPFSQVDGSTTRKYGGTGLGLSICLQLIQLMSGHIDVSSVPGEGSNFNFTIWTSWMSEESKIWNREINALLNDLCGTRLLMADTNQSAINMVRQMLPNITVHGVTTTEELKRHRDTKYDIVIVGLFLTQMPQVGEWAPLLRPCLAGSKCNIMLHYHGTGSFTQLLSESHHPPVSYGHGINTSLMVPHGDDDRPVSPYSVFKEYEGVFLRLAVPLRRKRLIQALLKAQRPNHASLTAPLLHTNPSIMLASRNQTLKASGSTTTSETVIEDERALYSTMHILAAEDNPVAQKLLYKQLTRLGFQVECANNGYEAVEAWLSHPPGYFQMGFFDHHMPKCDGVEATRTIRKREAEEGYEIRLPIVALSADVQQSARKICLEAGMNEYLTKPMNQKSMVDILRIYCKEPCRDPF